MSADYQNALQAYQECARMDSTRGRAYLLMGMCAQETDQFAEGVKQLEKASHFPEYQTNPQTMLQYMKAVQKQELENGQGGRQGNGDVGSKERENMNDNIEAREQLEMPEGQDRD